MNLGDQLMGIIEALSEKLSRSVFKNNEKAALAMECLTSFVGEHVDGWRFSSDVELIEIVEKRCEEIWDLISEEEKCRNPSIQKTYERAMGRIEALGTHLESEIYSEDFVDDSYDE